VGDAAFPKPLRSGVHGRDANPAARPSIPAGGAR
jgi:hypothetical protein